MTQHELDYITGTTPWWRKLGWALRGEPDWPRDIRWLKVLRETREGEASKLRWNGEGGDRWRGAQVLQAAARVGAKLDSATTQRLQTRGLTRWELLRLE